jgi:hypothetical protein
MANRHGRRSRQRSGPGPSSSSGTPTPDRAPSPESGDVSETDAEILEWPVPWPDGAGGFSFQRIERILAETMPSAEELERQWWARKNLETMGFVFPRPGEAFGELGGLPPPPDPLEERIRRELGL